MKDYDIAAIVVVLPIVLFILWVIKAIVSSLITSIREFNEEEKLKVEAETKKREEFYRWERDREKFTERRLNQLNKLLSRFNPETNAQKQAITICQEAFKDLLEGKTGHDFGAGLSHLRLWRFDLFIKNTSTTFKNVGLGDINVNEYAELIVASVTEAQENDYWSEVNDRKALMELAHRFGV